MAGRRLQFTQRGTKRDVFEKPLDRLQATLQTEGDHVPKSSVELFLRQHMVGVIDQSRIGNIRNTGARRQ